MHDHDLLKFFVNFVQAACVFSIYTFATLLGFTVHTSNTLHGDIDPQEIVVIALYVQHFIPAGFA